MTPSVSEQSFPVSDECVILIETISGDLDISGWDNAQVRVQASNGKATVHQEGSKLDIKPASTGSSDLELRVPCRCDLTLRAISGDIELRDVGGQIDLQTKSGDIAGENVRGELRVHTVSGDIELSGSCLSSLTVGTVSGDSLIESPLDVEGEYHVRSVSGNVHLRIPEDQSCTVRGKSLSGGFKCDLPHELDHQGRGKRGKWEARINGGGPELRVDTISGDVRVSVAATEPEETQPFADERATKPLVYKESKDEPFGLDEETAASQESKESPSSAAQRMEILKAIEEGEMSVDEGLAKLRPTSH